MKVYVVYVNGNAGNFQEKKQKKLFYNNYIHTHTHPIIYPLLSIQNYLSIEI